MQHSLYPCEKAPADRLTLANIESSRGWTPGKDYEFFPDWVDSSHETRQSLGFIGIVAIVVATLILAALIGAILSFKMTPEVKVAFFVLAGMGGLAILSEVQKKTTINKKGPSFQQTR